MWVACGVTSSLNLTSTGAPDICCNVCCVHVLNALASKADSNHSFSRAAFSSVAGSGNLSGREGEVLAVDSCTLRLLHLLVPDERLQLCWDFLGLCMNWETSCV